MSREFRIVPYDQSLAARNRRCDSGLSTFLRNGGAMRPLELGGYGRPAATGDDASEREGLIAGDRRYREKYYQESPFTGRILLGSIMCLIFVSFVVFAGLGYVVFRFNAQMETVRTSFAPHATSVVNSTLDMIKDTQNTIHNVEEMSKSGVSFGHMSVPEMNAMAKHSANITDQIAKLLAHPIIKLSLA